jgi:hypothetical protein
MKTAVLVIVTLLSLAVTNPAFAARNTLRCGSKIVTPGMTMDEVLKFCGEPQGRDVEEVPVRSGNRVTGMTEKHIWTYQRTGGKPASLTFDQNTLISIDYL